MPEDWRYIKDYVAVTSAEPVITDFLHRNNLPTGPHTTKGINDVTECIGHVETEEGAKSCITFNIEDLSPALIGAGFKKEAEELYSEFARASEKAIKGTWGKFIL